jgi:hypothetical protein
VDKTLWGQLTQTSSKNGLNLHSIKFLMVNGDPWITTIDYD